MYRCPVSGVISFQWPLRLSKKMSGMLLGNRPFLSFNNEGGGGEATHPTDFLLFNMIEMRKKKEREDESYRYYCPLFLSWQDSISSNRWKLSILFWWRMILFPTPYIAYDGGKRKWWVQKEEALSYLIGGGRGPEQKRWREVIPVESTSGGQQRLHEEEESGCEDDDELVPPLHMHALFVRLHATGIADGPVRQSTFLWGNREGRLSSGSLS